MPIFPHTAEWGGHDSTCPTAMGRGMAGRDGQPSAADLEIRVAGRYSPGAAGYRIRQIRSCR